MTGPDPSLFSEAEGGWEERGTRVTVRSSVIIVACARAPHTQCPVRFQVLEGGAEGSLKKLKILKKGRRPYKCPVG
jgi:hypothetical protein